MATADQVNIDRIKDRIRKLLAKDTDLNRDNEAEIATSLKIARKLADQYNLDLGEIKQDTSDESLKAGVVEERGFSRKGKVERMDVRLAQAMCELFEVDLILQKRFVGEGPKRSQGWRQYITFVGFQRDVALARALHSELTVVMRAMAGARMGSKWDVAKRSYCLGFADRIARRGREAKKVSVAEAGTTAIVLRKDKAIRDYMSGLNLKIERRGKSKHDWSGYDKGQEDGAKVSLATDTLEGKKGTTASPACALPLV